MKNIFKGLILTTSLLSATSSLLAQQKESKSTTTEAGKLKQGNDNNPGADKKVTPVAVISSTPITGADKTFTPNKDQPKLVAPIPAINNQKLEARSVSDAGQLRVPVNIDRPKIITVNSVPPTSNPQHLPTLKPPVIPSIPQSKPMVVQPEKVQ